MGFFDSKPNYVVAKGIIRDFGDVPGVEDAVDGYLALVESEIYKKTVFIGFDSVGDGPDSDRISMLNIVAKYLSTFPLRLPFIPIFDVKDFYVSFTFVWNIWACQLGRELNQEECQKIYYGDIVKRIIFLLEDFDSNENTPQVDEEFFRKLDKCAKKLSDRFLDLRQAVKMNTFNRSPMTFGANEIAWTRFLAGCSAVHSGRNVISAEDIVIGNKVYIKLVNTDLDSLIRSL
ncbi:MAG: hypothetical protein U1D70_16175 [Methylobacter sp.]|nr:hypothetical protein [Methylobacter sp.]